MAVIKMTQLQWQIKTICVLIVANILLCMGCGSEMILQDVRFVPNTFDVNKEATHLLYTLREDAKVRICIYDSTGKLVIQLLNESKEQGTYEVTWQGRNTKGGIVSTGLYVGSIEAGGDRVEVMVTLIDSTDKAGLK